MATRRTLNVSCPTFRLRVRNTHAREFTGPNALDLARSLGITEVSYWNIVEAALPCDV